MAVKKSTTSSTKKLVQDTTTQGSRPYSSPNATTNTSNTSRPYSSPNTTTSNVSLPSSLSTGSALSNIAKNTATTAAKTSTANTVKTASPQTVASQAAASVINNNTTPASNYVAPSTPSYSAPTSNYVAPSTPTVSTPKVTTPTLTTPTLADTLASNQTPSLNAVSGSLNESVAPTMQTGSLLGDLANANIREANPTIANMTPSQTTDLMLSLLGSQLADTRLTNSNPAARNAVNNLIRRNNSANQAVANAAYKTLVDSAEYPNENAPYSQVPNIGGGLAYNAVVNPDAIIRNTSNQNSLQTAIENAARAALDNAGVTTPTATSALDSILNPDKALYGLTGGYGDININAEGGSSEAEGGTGGRSSGGSGGGGTRGSGSGLASGLGDGYLDISALYDLLNQRLGEYDANYSSLLDALNANYENMLNALGLNYSDTEALLNTGLANSRSELENARRRALQEAYISRMMQEKNLADQLDAYGLTGGATESVMANMRNNYANNRNSVEENTQNNLRDLLQKYLENMSNARQRYNDSLLKAQSSRLSDLNNAANYRSQARAGAYEDLYNTFANLTMKGINYGS